MRSSILFLAVVFAACDNTAGHTYTVTDSFNARQLADSVTVQAIRSDSPRPSLPEVPAPEGGIQTGNVKAAELMDFAETLQGIPYVYASSDPAKGFDCSGFITYVFNHFNIGVPRSSVDFTNVGTTIPVNAARRGDIILFAGTEPGSREVGHMGLVTSNTGGALSFIHSTSGKAMGVVITPLNEQYRRRFVRIARIFPG